MPPVGGTWGNSLPVALTPVQDSEAVTASVHPALHQHHAHSNILRPAYAMRNGIPKHAAYRLAQLSWQVLLCSSFIRAFPALTA